MSSNSNVSLNYQTDAKYRLASKNWLVYLLIVYNMEIYCTTCIWEMCEKNVSTHLVQTLSQIHQNG